MLSKEESTTLSKPEYLNGMLSKAECIKAIDQWESVRLHYSKIQKLIKPTSVFSFKQHDCNWINTNNESCKFHAYIGVHQGKLILIAAPLDRNENEKDLDEYKISALTELDNDLTLTETEVVTTTKKTTLNSKLEISGYSEEVQKSVCNEPTIKERTCANEIEKWKNECLDWFQYECNEKGGRRIFKAFKVPFSDLIKEEDEYDEVKVMFGFKYCSIHQITIPVLIFVATHSVENFNSINNTKPASIIRSMANTKDWSQPCPPMCAEPRDFAMLKR